ncbi:MAG: hypothetical protein JST08_00425 [Actinobacteria bacterium]|nr:hypothetical protein [Actinomycetota bacterium]
MPDDRAGRTAVDAPLACLVVELELDDRTKLRQGDGHSIVVRDVEPGDLWRATDRAVPDWEARDLASYDR